MKTPLLVPRTNPNDEQVEIVQWHAQNGQSVKSGFELCEFATSKANFIFEAPGDGFIQIIRQKGERVGIGQLFANLCSTVEETRSNQSEVSVAKSSPIFSQRARDLMIEHGLQEKDFTGQTFVTERDVKQKSLGQKPKTLSFAKEAEIAVLSRANQNALRSSLTIHIPAAPALDKIAKLKVAPAAALAFAAAQAIQKNPWILEQFDNTSDEISLNYAMDLGFGVKPLCVKDFANDSIAKWNERLANWGLKVMRNEVQPAEMAAGRFTVTDLSQFGIHTFEPLLVGEQSAILGIGSDLPAGQNTIFTGNLAFDHRVHSGRQGALFLQDFREILLDLPTT